MGQVSTSNVDVDFIQSLLVPLLKINTENPPGNELGAARLVAGWLEARGIQSSVYGSDKDRGSLVAVATFGAGGPNFLMNGHLDTQPLGGGWRRDPCGAEIEGDRIFGRGTGDMKSGVAAMAAAMAAVVKSGHVKRGSIIFAATADETSGGYRGLGAVLDQVRALKPTLGIVGEPTLGDISVGNRGVVWIRIVVRGKSGQAGKTHTGVNAISAAAAFVKAVESALPGTYRQNQSRYLPPQSINWGVIEGGIKPNVIASECVIRLDRRTILGETEHEVLAAIRAIADRVEQDTGASIDLSTELVVPADEIDASETIVSDCQLAFEQVTGRTPKVRALYGFTDVHFLTQGLGIPAVNFGPWYLTSNPSGSFSDIPDEYASIDEIVIGARVYERLISNILGGHP